MAKSMKNNRVDNWLAYAGKKLYRNKYGLVLVEAESKRPMNIKVRGEQYSWKKHKVTDEMLDRLIAKDRKGSLGIKCGRLIALDNDYEEGTSDMVDDLIPKIDELVDHFFPEYMLRQGRPTRRPLRVIQVEDAEEYVGENVCSFQILGKGRYFAAYGVHPDTEEPYRWLEIETRGEPLSMEMDEVPMYQKEHIDEFRVALHSLHHEFGMSPRNGGDVMERIKRGEAIKPAEELMVERSVIEHAASFIVNKEEWGWEEWNGRIMMPLWAASNGEDWGLALAHKISSQHNNYDKDVTDQRWEDITNSPPSRVGGGTLMWEARQNGMSHMGPREWDKYRAMREQAELYDVVSGRIITRSEFNDVYAKHRDKMNGLNAYQTFLDVRKGQVFDSLLWDPSLPHGDNTVGKSVFYNTCVMPTSYGKKGKIGVWMQLMEDIYRDPKQLKNILKRMAFDVQYPHLKPMWHELIIGKQGVGKNLKNRPLRMWFKEMSTSINAADFISDFNGYAAKMKMIEVEELAGADMRVANKIKNMLASADPFIKVNEKYIKAYRSRNVLSFWLSANEVDPISIQITERRYYVTRARDKRIPRDETTRISNWIDENWEHVIWYLKNEVHVDEAFGQVLPEVTQDMRMLTEIAGRNHSQLAMKIEKMVANHNLVSFVEIKNALFEMDHVDANDRMVAKALSELRFVSTKTQISVNGERVRLWTRDPKLVNAGSNQLQGEWMVEPVLDQTLCEP